MAHIPGIKKMKGGPRPGTQPKMAKIYPALSEDASDNRPLQVEVSVDAAAGEAIQITIETFSPETGSFSPPPPPVRTYPAPTTRRRAWKPEWGRTGTLLRQAFSRLRQVRPAIGGRVLTLEEILFGLVIIVYLSTRLIGLTQFPIYFFTDEAIQTVQAADFVSYDFHNADRDFFPTYFVNGNQYNLSLSVYLQVIPYLMFGKSELATRGTAVLSTLLGAICIGLILKNIFKIKFWWAGTLILSITPAWFLHSRTAFETALMVSMYTAFLYFYLRYRTIAPKNLYLALIFGGLTFYAYSPGQVIMGVTGVLLLLFDSRYHWQNRKVGLIGLGVLALVALPYARFLITRGAENYKHLQILGSYWTDPIPLSEKLRLYFSEYLSGLNPAYWYLPNDHDLMRHLMKGYGHLLRWTFPFAALGLAICLKPIFSSLRRILLVVGLAVLAAAALIGFSITQQPAFWIVAALLIILDLVICFINVPSMYRVILFALLAAPSGAALVGIGITRLLVMVVPATLLTTLGLAACLTWLAKHRLPEKALAFGVLIPLVAFNFFMLNDALVNGPQWYSDYGLGGMQWGANRIFPAVADYLKASPQTNIILSPSWANGTDVVARFFLPDPLPVKLGSIDGYIFSHLPLDDNTLFVMIPEEFKAMQASNKFTDIRVEKTLLYPNGTPGFYFVRLRYVDNIDAMLEAEKIARSTLQTGTVTINGQAISVSYSMLDMGSIQNVFDGDTGTLVRSLEANPLVIELAFPQPTAMSSVTVRVGGVYSRVTAILQVEGQSSPLVFKNELPQTQLPKDLTVSFGSSLTVTSIRLEILSVNDSEPAHIHVWEVTFK